MTVRTESEYVKFAAALESIRQDHEDKLVAATFGPNGGILGVADEFRSVLAEMFASAHTRLGRDAIEDSTISDLLKVAAFRVTTRQMEAGWFNEKAEEVLREENEQANVWRDCR